jgi:ribosomal protein L21
MITHAIVEASGKQLIVQEGGFYDISNLPLKEKETFFF